MHGDQPGNDGSGGHDVRHRTGLHSDRNVLAVFARIELHAWRLDEPMPHCDDRMRDRTARLYGHRHFDRQRNAGRVRSRKRVPEWRVQPVCDRDGVYAVESLLRRRCELHDGSPGVQRHGDEHHVRDDLPRRCLWDSSRRRHVRSVRGRYGVSAFESLSQRFDRLFDGCAGVHRQH